MRHETLRKRRLQQLYVTVLTSLQSRCLAKKERFYIYRHRFWKGIYEARCWDGRRCHDVRTKFHKDRFNH
jgi:hypothetical protein